MKQKAKETPKIWSSEINDKWHEFCPSEIRNKFTGGQLCWIKSFAYSLTPQPIKVDEIQQLQSKVKELEEENKELSKVNSDNFDIVIKNGQELSTANKELTEIKEGIQTILNTHTEFTDGKLIRESFEELLKH